MCLHCADCACTKHSALIQNEFDGISTVDPNNQAQNGEQPKIAYANSVF